MSKIYLTVKNMGTFYSSKFSFAVLLLCSLFVIDCATYWSHRKNDLADVFTAGVETPGYGVGIRIGPMATGFIFQGGETSPGKRDLGTGYGLRGGSYGPYRAQQLVFGILGGEKFHSLPNSPQAPNPEPKEQNKNTQTDQTTPSPGGFLFPDVPEPDEDPNPTPELANERQNAKSYNIRYLQFYHNPVEERRKAKKEAFYKRILASLDPEKKNEEIQTFLAQNPKNKDDYPSAFLFDIEIYIAVRYGVRVGFNVGEFLDFIFGFTGLDLMEDDI